MVNAIRLIIEIVQGGECILEVLPTTLITDIKLEISEILLIPENRQKLLLAGRALEDFEPLNSYPDIKDGTKLKLVLKKPDGFLDTFTKYFRLQGMPEEQAKATAVRIRQVLQEKFDRLTWDQVDELAADCMRTEKEDDWELQILNRLNSM